MGQKKNPNNNKGGCGKQYGSGGCLKRLASFQKGAIRVPSGSIDPCVVCAPRHLAEKRAEHERGALAQSVSLVVH